MTKSQLTISVDADLREYFSNSKINVSGICNDFLRGYKDKDSNTVNALNLQIKKKELEQKQKEHAVLTSELMSLQKEIETHETEKSEAELQRLKMEKDRQESLSHCKCGKAIDGPIKVKGKELYLCLDCANNEA